METQSSRTSWIPLLVAVVAACGTGGSSVPSFEPFFPCFEPGDLGCTSGRAVSFSLRSVSPEGAAARTITSSSLNVADPAVSPDGALVAFDCLSSDLAFDLCVIRRDGTERQSLIRDAASDFLPAFTPDGRALFFTSNRDGNFDIFCLASAAAPEACGPTARQLGDRALRRLTDEPAADSDPAVSPDGSRIAFASRRGGQFDIYTMDRDGEDVRPLTQSPGDDFSPTWHPQGMALAFVSTRDGNAEIYLVGADGTGLRNLTRHPAADRNPSFSPDGRAIAFDSDRGRGTVPGGTRCRQGAPCPQLFLMDAAGGTVRQLTEELDAAGQHRLNANPTWSPDGGEIVLESVRF